MSGAHLINTPLAHYESAYSRLIGEYAPSQSLVSYLQLCQKRWRRNFFAGNWLELGCGIGSTFEALEDQGPEHVLGVDFSLQATKRASSRDLSNLNFELDFECHHLEREWPVSWGQFDGILDAHLLHCLNGKDEIERSLLNCLKHLAEGAPLVAEVMVHSKCFTPDGELVHDTQSGILKREGGPTLHTLLAAYDWEQILLKCGFQIFYFEVYSHLRFIHNPKRSHMLESDPELLRFIALKPKE